MTGQIVGITGGSGWTWCSQAEDKWSRIDSWWAMEGMEVRDTPNTPGAPAPFTDHRGVGIRWAWGTIRQHHRQPRVGTMPPEEDPVWDVFRQRLARLLQQAKFQGEEPEEILAAWDLAARETLPMTKGGKFSTDPIKQGVPTLLPLQVWGTGRVGSKQMWQALRDMRGKWSHETGASVARAAGICGAAVLARGSRRGAGMARALAVAPALQASDVMGQMTMVKCTIGSRVLTTASS
eukprot:gene14500-biopygen3602